MTVESAAAWRRDWRFDHPDLAEFPALAAARTFSCRTNARLADLAARLDPAPGLVCLAVAGSLGRLEAMEDSDCDLIVIVEPDIPNDSPAAKRLMARVWEALAPAGLKRPKGWGIFTEPANAHELTAVSALGSLEDDVALYGKRMQLLLDAQPIFGEPAFFALQQRLVGWFETASQSREPDFAHAYLLGEVVRYYRTYASWQHFRLSVESDENWTIRQLKLIFSRRAMYAGLVLSLAHAWTEADPRAALFRSLALPPLERICLAAGADRARAILGSYEVFQRAMNDAATRASLIAEGPVSLTDLDMPMDERFVQLKRSGDAFGDLLAALIDQRLKHAPPALARSFFV